MRHRSRDHAGGNVGQVHQSAVELLQAEADGLRKLGEIGGRDFPQHLIDRGALILANVWHATKGLRVMPRPTSRRWQLASHEYGWWLQEPKTVPRYRVSPAESTWPAAPTTPCRWLPLHRCRTAPRTHLRSQSRWFQGLQGVPDSRSRPLSRPDSTAFPLPRHVHATTMRPPEWYPGV